MNDVDNPVGFATILFPLRLSFKSQEGEEIMSCHELHGCWRGSTHFMLILLAVCLVHSTFSVVHFGSCFNAFYITKEDFDSLITSKEMLVLM